MDSRIMGQQYGITTKSINGLDHWNDVVSQTFCPMNCSSIDKKVTPKIFTGGLDCTPLNRIHLARITSSALDVNRSKKDISIVSGEASYLVKFQLKGEGLVKQRGHEAHLKPGDFVICSSSEPYDLHFPSEYYQAVLAIPQKLLRDMFHVPDDYLGIKMDSNVPIHGILSQFVNSLVQRMDMLQPATVQRLEANILDLLITSLQAEQSATLKKPINAADKHLQHIKRFISLHLKDRRLSPDCISHAEGISKRYLHRLFKDENLSVSKYIQQLRLKACKNALSNPELQHLTTTDIALDCGFGDISHFHRCFKAQYNMTPRQLRIQAKNN